MGADVIEYIDDVMKKNFGIIFFVKLVGLDTPPVQDLFLIW